MSFKYKPVVWLTILGVVLAGAIELDAQYDILPDGVVAWIVKIAGVIAFILTAIKTYGSVTPLARPRLDDDTPLVPVSSRR